MKVLRNITIKDVSARRRWWDFWRRDLPRLIEVFLIVEDGTEMLRKDGHPNNYRTFPGDSIQITFPPDPAAAFVSAILEAVDVMMLIHQSPSIPVFDGRDQEHEEWWGG